jgi:nitroreductase
MDFLTLAKNRFSSRKYRDQKVDLETLTQLIEAAQVAPSAVNYQPWHFVLFANNQGVTRLSEAYPREWFKAAPAAIVVCGNHQQSWKREDGKDHCDIDIAIAVDHISLKATEMGLGTCWVCNFNAQTCKQILNLPDYMEPIVILPVGYPAENSDPNRHSEKRKKIEELFSVEIFGKK